MSSEDEHQPSTPPAPTSSPTTTTSSDEPTTTNLITRQQMPSLADDVIDDDHPPPLPPSTPNEKTKARLSWENQAHDDTNDDTIVIEEELPPSRPVKKAWRQSSSRPKEVTGEQSDAANGSGGNSIDSTTTTTPAATTTHSSSSIGSKPKQTNMSLLSSAVAHATLERCLLGVNGGLLSEIDDPNSSSSPSIVNYSKQCKPGHVIDLLELRRLSSRGVPDEPPEVRSPRIRAVSAPFNNSSSTANTSYNSGSSTPIASPPNNNNNNLHSSTSAGNVQSTTGNPHRSYRPLVWRVLLGYLPPQTDLWNDVLTRDRKLYANLVKELFSSTCPAPHEIYDEEAMRRRQKEEEEVRRTSAFLEDNRVFRSDERRIRRINSDNTTDGDVDGIPSTPVEELEENLAVSSPPPPTTTPMTPGLLSARMQQEWIRGEDSVFRTPGGSDNGDIGNARGSSAGRISPMCAMNTPRSRSRKKPLPTADTIMEGMKESAGTDEGGESTTASTTMSTTTSGGGANDIGREDGGGGDDVTGMMNSLLLPDDMEDGEEEKGESPAKDGNVSRSISITTDEGVELYRRGSGDVEDDLNLDEEENVHLLDEIRKDVIRTHPDLRFFLEPKEDLGQKRYAALERILFVWAKLNKGVRYVQGMNEIVGTLYFVLAHDSNEDWANEAEADTYFLFNSLMVEMRDVFVPDLDEADTGIHGRISNMITLLALHDPEVRCHLDNVGIDPSFYSVRWLTTLLSREFLLPDTIRLWDSMFASTHKDNFLRYVSVTMVMVIHDQLLQGDFSACLRLLQAYPPTNLDRLLESSRALWIYESQITLACHKGGISLGHALRSITPPPAIIMAYGLPRGIAPPLGAQVRQVGERGLAAARGAANGASHSVANAGRSFFGNAMEYWRSGSAVSRQKKEMHRSKTTSM